MYKYAGFACKIASIFLCLQIIDGQQQGQQQQQCYDGAQTRKGNFWYVCRNGYEVPVSCMAEDGTRFDIGNTYKTASFVLQCSQPGPGAIQLKPVACVNNGHVISPGNIYTNDQMFYYRCYESDTGLQVQLAGCVGGTGELVVNGGTVKRGAFIYRCIMTGTGIRLEPSGCTFENRQYQTGEEILTPTVWYKCESDSNGMSIKLLGCVKNGVKHRLDERFSEGNFLFKCTLKGNQIYPMAVGCVERSNTGYTQEYYNGNRWLVRMPDNNQYLMECQLDHSTIKRVAVQCYYNKREGTGYLDGGCMRRVGPQLIQCMPVTDHSANVRMVIAEFPTKADEQRLLTSGMKFC